MIRTSRILITSLSTLVLVTAGLLAPVAHGDDNVIGDDNLQACLNTGINRPVDTAITAAELSAWTGDISCGSQNIASLDGLEYLSQSGSSTIDLQNNQITDISALKDQNIGYLDISTNHISSIAPLQGMTSLSNLRAMDNTISDMSVVATLTGLTILALNNNQISDPSAISGLPSLGMVGLSNNKISDISGLTNLPQVQALNLTGNQISDLSVLATAAPHLSTLSINGNAVTDLSPVAAAGKQGMTIHATDQKVSLSATVGTAVPIPMVNIVDDLADAPLVSPLMMTPPSTMNISLNEVSGTVTYLAAGTYSWTWYSNLVNTEFSGSLTVTVTGAGTDNGTGSTDNNKDESTASNTTTTENPAAAPTGGTATSATPLVGVLLIVAGMVLLVVRRQTSPTTR